MVEHRESFDEQIRFAIANRRLVEVRYSRASRVAEPHDYGLLKGVTRLLVFQRHGPHRPGHVATGWRLLDVPKLEALGVLDETFPGSRGDAYRDHYLWEIVYARVK